MAKKPTFRQMLKYSLILDKEESELFDKIPDAIFDNIFKINFNSNINTAERVLFNRYGKLQQIETERLEREKRKIPNLKAAVKKLVDAVDNNRKVLFLTDTDNDGSLSQAILIEFLKLLPEDKKSLIKVEYAQPLGNNHGFTYEMVEKATEELNWSVEEDFVIITADNGINNRSEQERIQEKWINSELVVTDQHLADDKFVVVENDKTVIFDPKYKNPSEYFKEKNISGANTLGVYLTEVYHSLSKVPESEYSEETKETLKNIKELGYWANHIDFVSADISDMPVRPYVMSKAIELTPLMNISNSMSQFVTGEFSDELLESVETATNGVLSKEWTKKYIKELKALNLLSQKFLSLYKEKEANPEGFTADFYTYLSKEIAKPDLSKISYKSMNPNYIQQLRPVIFNLSAIDNKNNFDATLADNMIKVYQSLKRKERELLDKIRPIDLLKKDSLEFSKIFYPSDKKITKLLNRKLLGKAYNEANNGFNLIISSMKDNLVTGSMRTIYPITEILKGKEKFEAENGVSLYFKGHELAAGFFIESNKEGVKIDNEMLKKVNVFINERVKSVKENYIDETPTVEIDFESVGLINKINNAVKSNLSGKVGVPAIISFSADANKEVWITDNKTTAQINLKDAIKDKKYGYLPIATDLHGGAFIAPVELLRNIIDNDFEPRLRLSYLADGAHIGSQVVDSSKIANLVTLGQNVDKKAELTEYYKEAYKDSHFIPLDREYFSNLPYFKYNKYGEKEFLNFENLILTLLEKSGRDILSVVDTEGTGLGKAPRCFNIGSTNIQVDYNSGEKISLEDFNEGLFKTANGYNVLLTPEQIESLVSMDNSEDTSDYDMKSQTVLYKANTEDGVSGDRFVYIGAYKELNIVSNFIKTEEDTVIMNRKISGFASGYLIKENDFAIPKEFEKLTGISQGMLNELGSSASFVDEDMTKHYESLKNDKNEPAKIIFQAHNMPYDKGVISSNFDKFNKFMNTQLISDSAKMARLDKLAYDDTPVCSFKNLPGMSKMYFYDSPFSDYSMTTFLLRTAEGKGGVFPDITAKFLLKYNEKTQQYSLIDREKKDEFILPVTFEELYGLFEDDAGYRDIGDLPNNAVKYSVERLSSRAMIRNIILNDELKIQRLELEEEEQPFVNLLNYFQDNYHFDDTMESNLLNFKYSVSSEDGILEELFTTIDMKDFTERFLLLNKKIQAKFHDGWIYEKVLNQYEPKSTDRVITKNMIEQINYYTDLPDSKIKEVLSDVIKFKKDFNITHAIVHEQHNNIIQKSEDGMGLSDTAYESILPQLLGLMKHYNPYLHSVDMAVKEMINKNIKGSMVQFLLKDINDENLAKDSFSMKQTLSFNRENKTDLVNNSNRLVDGSVFEEESESPIVEEVKFKLSTDTLPPASAIYAKTRQHVEQESIYDISEKLDFILINEQVKNAIKETNKVLSTNSDDVAMILKANNDISIGYRNEILSKFDSVEFERREHNFKKVADILVEAIEMGQLNLSSRTKVDVEMIKTAKVLVSALNEVLTKINPETDETMMLDSCIDKLEEQYKNQLEKEKKKIESERKKLEKARAKITTNEVVESVEEKTEVEEEPLNESVSQDNFLPKLDIVRQNPFKYLLNQGMEYCLPYLSDVLEKNEEKLEISKVLSNFKITSVKTKKM